MTVFDLFFSGERLNLTEKTRKSLPGEFVQLSDGVTHYELSSPADSDLTVFVHGFSVPYFIWDATFAALHQSGLRVLRYDLFGRGYSDRPMLANNKDLFVRQLEELLSVLSVSSPVNIVSLSMGAVVATDFANRFPERVNKLAFVDPTGFDLEFPLAVRLLYLPGMGEILLGGLGLFGQRSLLQGMLRDFYQPSQAALDAFVPRYLEQMKYRGFKRSLLSTLRNGLLDEDLGAFQKLGKSGKAVLLIWGREDQTVPFRHHQSFLELVPQSEFHAINKAGHIPHFERAEIVNPLLLRFLHG